MGTMGATEHDPAQAVIVALGLEHVEGADGEWLVGDRLVGAERAVLAGDPLNPASVPMLEA